MPFGIDLESSVRNLIVLLLSLTFHEFFHAWTAWRLGDDTAALQGRLTLNPLPHIDLFGTILLPLFGAPIGWAKPVPVNPSRFNRNIGMAKGDILVSAAGPLSNIALGTIAAILYGVMVRLAPDVSWAPAVRALLVQFMLVNAGLAIFNLLPIPPLDGGHVAQNLVPYRWRAGWDRFAQLGPFVLLALLVLEQTGGLPLLSLLIGPPRALVLGVYSHIAQVIA